MKFRKLCAAALAAAAMAATAVTASAIEVTADNSYDLFDRTVYEWEGMSFIERLDGTLILEETKENYNVAELVIPNAVNGISVSAIQGEVFSGCASLTSAVIPDSVTVMGGSVFLNCINLTDIFYEGTEEQWNALDYSGNDNTLAIIGVPNATIHFNSAGSGSTSAKPAPSGNTKYDIDGNGTVNISDVIALLRKVVNGETNTAFDVNGDGAVSISDVISLLRVVVSGRA